jgi:hypothetical protein
MGFPVESTTIDKVLFLWYFCFMTDAIEKYVFEKPTICADCHNLVLDTKFGLKTRSEIGSTEVKGIWYNFYCGAKVRETGVDYVTGKLGYVSVNDLNRQNIVEEPYPYCREVNVEGNCPDFVLSETPVAIQ